MKFPDYFDQIPRLRVQDPLARIFGCAEGGILEYGFADAVRITGHACPTVASAYWLTLLALEHLYPQELPLRGGIKVEFRDDARSGSSGVIATVIQMLTGAAGGSGFKGLGGRYSRAGLIRSKPDLLMQLRFTRLDKRVAVDVGANLGAMPEAPLVDSLMGRVASGRASAEEEERLGALWRQRVREMLLEHGRDGTVFMVCPVEWKKRSDGVPQAA